jgi:hypothetical protein
VTARAARPAEQPSVWPWAQALILARGTWRLAWREPLTRLLLALGVVLALVGSIAAVGSPTAGDGAVQMLAVCLEIVPFAVVLLAADIWRRDADELPVAARPVDGLSYVGGRALGLCLVGGAMLAVVALVSALGLWAIARLPLIPAAAWLALFAAVVVVPSLVLLAAASLGLLAWGGAGPRYHAVALVGALLVAFYSYKLGAMAQHAALHALPFFAPFPGLLTLGLALPPAALGAPPIPAWLWWNRLLFLALALLLLALAARRRGRGLRLFPTRSLGAWRAVVATTAAVAVATAVPLAGAAGQLAPAVQPAAPQLPGVAVPAAAELALAVTVDAAAGTFRGRALWRLGRPVRGVEVLLNAGLRLVPPPAVTAVASGGGALVPATAARLYRLTALRPRAAWSLAFSGRLLPQPSTLPYPPFPLAQAFEGAAAGAGRLFLNGRGTWYPVVVGAGLVPAAPGRVTLDLRVVHGRGAWWGLPARGTAAALHLAWAGTRLPPVVGLLAPYRTFRVGGWTIAADRPPSATAARALAAYAVAAADIRRADPRLLAGTGLEAVSSPLLTAPQWSVGILWLPGDEPFCRPSDPVRGTCGGPAPTVETAALTLSLLAWQARWGAVADGLALPWPQPVQRQAAAVAPLALVSAWRALGEPAGLAHGWTQGAALPVIGTLTAAQRSLAARRAAGDAQRGLSGGPG